LAPGTSTTQRDRSFDELARKIAVVKENCEKIDRDPATLETSMLVGALIGDGLGPTSSRMR